MGAPPARREASLPARPRHVGGAQRNARISKQRHDDIDQARDDHAPDERRLPGLVAEVPHAEPRADGAGEDGGAQQRGLGDAHLALLRAALVEAEEREGDGVADHEPDEEDQGHPASMRERLPARRGLH